MLLALQVLLLEEEQLQRLLPSSMLLVLPSPYARQCHLIRVGSDTPLPQGIDRGGRGSEPSV